MAQEGENWNRREKKWRKEVKKNWSTAERKSKERGTRVRTGRKGKLEQDCERGSSKNEK